jgi:6,7-dimethyl-8-ribityllumazine synthase
MLAKHKIGIIVSRFNQDITEQLLTGALSHLKQQGVADSAITLLRVPGAVEIPIAAQHLAKSGKYAAIICLGAVIQGDTDHHLYVNEQVSQGCQQVMLKYDLPVIFGILTTHTEEQAWQRAGGTHGHKGQEAAEVALEMIALLQTNV